MATSNVRNIFKTPGRLFMNPTSLTVEANYGTELGTFRQAFLTIDQPYQWIEAEEYGGQKVDGVVTKEGCSIGALLHSWDADLIQKLFPNTAAGDTTHRRRVVSPSTIRPGELMSTRAMVLYFVPDDPVRHPSFLMRRAIPATEEQFQVALKIDEEFGIPVVFYGIRDANGNLYDWGLPHDLTL